MQDFIFNISPDDRIMFPILKYGKHISKAQTIEKNPQTLTYFYFNACLALGDKK